MSDAFDKKLREKLSEGEVPFDPDAWKKMEKKLDALNDDGPSRKPFWWWLAPLLLLLIGTGAFMWWRHTDQPGKQPPASAEVPAAADPATVAPAKETQPPVTRATPAAPAGEPAPTVSSPSAAKTGAGQPVTPAVPSRPGEQEVANPAVATGKQAQALQPPATGTLVHRQQPPNVTGPTTVPAANNMLHLLSTLYAGNTPVAADLHAVPRVLLKEIKPLPEENGQQNRKDQVPSRKGFSVGLMLGPVFNVAPSLQYGRIGVDAGILLSYHVNNRWSFSTGAVYSMKPYGGTPGDYGVTKDWLPPYDPAHTVRQIDANCNVLDIPLNINYTFMDRPNYALSATAGISSYFMLKEKYTYKYQGVYDKGYELRNQNKHYFSVLNLAFTYQFPLSRHSSLGIQPFVKVPLKEVGYGQVKLYSTGVTIQMNLNMRRKNR